MLSGGEEIILILIFTALKFEQKVFDAFQWNI